MLLNLAAVHERLQQHDAMTDRLIEMVGISGKGSSDALNKLCGMSLEGIFGARLQRRNKAEIEGLKQYCRRAVELYPEDAEALMHVSHGGCCCGVSA